MQYAKKNYARAQSDNQQLHNRKNFTAFFLNKSHNGWYNVYPRQNERKYKRKERVLIVRYRDGRTQK